MSLTSIPAGIWNMTKSAVSRLPGLNNLSTYTKLQEGDNSLVLRANNFLQTKKNDETRASYKIAPQLRAMTRNYQASSPSVEESNQALRQIVKDNISIIEEEGIQKVKFKAEDLRIACENHIDKREQDYLGRIEELHYRNGAKTSNGELINLEEYDDVFHSFFEESLSVVHSLNNIIAEHLSSSDNLQATDHDLAEAFYLSKCINSRICNKLLGDFQKLLDLIPAESETNPSSKYSNEIKEHFKDQIIALNQGAYFGVLNRDHAALVVNEYLKKADIDSYNSTDLVTMSHYYKGIHGCLALGNNLQTTEVASFDPKISQNVIKDLNRQLIRRTQTDDPEELRKINHHIVDLTRFIASAGKEENIVHQKVDDFATDIDLQKFNISQDEINPVCSAYADIYTVNGQVGRTSEDIVAGERFDDTALISTFASLSSSNEFSRQYERLVLEASLLAAYHAVAHHNNELSNEDRLKLFSEEGKFKNFDTKEEVPWLQELYESEYQRYLEQIKNDKSAIPTTDTTISINKLSKRLASPEIGAYKSDDFFRRYGLVDIAENFLKRLTRTDVNAMALNLMSLSQAFSDIEKDSKAIGLLPNQTKWLSRHVEFLRDISTIKSKSGAILYSPEDGNPYEQAKFDEIRDYFSKPGTVEYNIDLVLKYFEKSIEEKKSKVVDQDKGFDKYSDLHSRNLLLSSAVLYYYLKFMPKTSKTVDSLRTREKVLETIFKPEISVSKNLPGKIGPKILDHILGTESDENGKPYKEGMYEAKGIIRGYALELQDKLNQYIKGEKVKNIDLQSLLHFYHRLEKLKNQSLEREHQAHPENADKDVIDIKDEELNLWSRQEKYHRKFYGGKKDELLPPLKEQLDKLLKDHTTEVIKFVSQLGDKELKEDVCRRLFSKSAVIARNIHKHSANKNVIRISDSQINTLKYLVTTMSNLAHISNLMSSSNHANYIIGKNSILASEDRARYRKDLYSVKKLLDSKFLLVNSENKTTAPVRKLKAMALSLLKAFRVKPCISNHLEWTNEARVEKLIKDKLAKTQDAPDLVQAA